MNRATVDASATTPTPPRITRWTRIAYGSGAAAWGVKDVGFSAFLLIFYSQCVGVDAQLVGLALMLALVADAIFEPVLGYVSDNTRSRWGRRHPFMYASAAPVAITFALIWSPPYGATDLQLFAYLLVLALLTRAFITMYETPSMCIVAEITDDYDERTRLFSIRYFFAWGAGLLMAALTYALFLVPTEKYASGILNRDGWRTYGFTAAGVIFASILISSLSTHGRIPFLRQPPPKVASSLTQIARELIETLRNRPFWILFISAIFFAMGQGLVGGLNAYVNFYFWELSQAEVLSLTVVGVVAALLGAPLAPVLSRRMGKRNAALMVGMMTVVLAPLPISLRILGLMPPNGSPALPVLLGGFTVFEFSGLVLTQILVAAMFADVVEQSQVHTGRRSEGVLFAARGFIQKSVSGLGIYGAGLLLKAVDFPRETPPGQVDAAVISRLGQTYAPVVFVFFLAATLVLTYFGISKSVHEGNLRAASDRARRLSSESER